jgi:MFS family permease
MINFNKQVTKYIFFGLLTIPRGIILSLSLIIIPIYLYENNIPFHIISLIVGISSAPWVIKFFSGWIVDYYSKLGRKIFVIIGGVICSISLCTIIFFDPEISLIPFVLLLISTNIGLIFLDTSKSAWLIDISEKKELGKINGIMFSFQFFIMALISLLLSILSNVIHYTAAFILSGICILFISIIPHFFDETIIKKTISQKTLFLDLLKEQKTRTISFFAFISSITGGIIILTIPLYVKDVYQFDIGQIGLLSVLFLLSRASGSLLSGIMADRYERKISIFLFILISIVLYPFFTILNSWECIYFLYCIIGFFLGGIQSIMSTIFMDDSKNLISATNYSMYASFFNVGRLSGEIVSGFFIISIGFSKVFLLCSWFLGVSLIILYFLRIK